MHTSPWCIYYHDDSCCIITPARDPKHTENKASAQTPSQAASHSAQPAIISSNWTPAKTAQLQIPKKDVKVAIDSAKEWLNKTKQKYNKVTANECRYCHSQLAPDIIKNRVRSDGYFVQAMEGCKDEE